MMVVQGAHTDPHLPDLLDLIQEQVRAELQAQQQVPETTTKVTPLLPTAHHRYYCLSLA